MKKIKLISFLIATSFFTMCKQQGYDLNIIFTNVDGLEIKDEVIVNGLQIGSVKDMKLIENGVLVTLIIQNETSMSNFRTHSGMIILRQTESYGQRSYCI